MRKKNSRIPRRAISQVQLFSLVICAAIIAVTASTLVQNSRAAIRPGGSARLALSQINSNDESNREISVAIKVHPEEEDINAVQAFVRYPSDKLEYIGTYDSCGGPFDLQIEANHTLGEVQVACGSTIGVRAEQTVAVLAFRKISSDDAVLSFTDASIVASRDSNKNVLGQIVDLDTQATSSAPVIKEILPKKASTTGGTVVTLTGEGFQQVQGVRVGDSNARSFAVDSDNQMTVVLPENERGFVSMQLSAQNQTTTYYYAIEYDTCSSVGQCD